MTWSTAPTRCATCCADARLRDRPLRVGDRAPARRALAERLPFQVATAAAEFITGPLLRDPRRVGKPLGAELAGISSVRLGRDWRVRYEIDDAKLVVVILDIRHRSAAYRRR